MISKAVEMVRSWCLEMDLVVVASFGGISNDSASISAGLDSLNKQLQIISRGKDAFVFGADNSESDGLGQVPLDFDGRREFFTYALEDWKCQWGHLVLFIDSVDQLDNSNVGRQLGWLPVEFSENVHLVVSMIPDGVDSLDGRPFRGLSILQGRCQQSAFTEVKVLGDPRELLQFLLRSKLRRITAKQMQSLIQALDKTSMARTPLMMTLLADLASSWRSGHVAIAAESIPSSVQGIIQNVFHCLYRAPWSEDSTIIHKRFVESTLLVLSLVRRGVSETELLEILSLQDDVVADITHIWSWTPQVFIPWAPLFLILNKLAPYLSRREEESVGVVRFWYHLQFLETARMAYLHDPHICAESHTVLFDFFSGEWSEHNKTCSKYLAQRVGKTACLRFVRSQPLVLNGKSPLFPALKSM